MEFSIEVNIMQCPVCENGEIKKIIFKKTQKKAQLCDICGALWFEGELVTSAFPRTIVEYSQDQDIAYVFEELDEKDQDHQYIVEERNLYEKHF